MPLNSRAKGKRVELEACAALRGIGCGQARRGRQYSGDPTAPDVVGVPGIHLEIKGVQNLSIHAAMRQACDDCGDQPPVIMHKQNRGGWLITCRFDDWLRVSKALLGGIEVSQ